MKNTCVSHSNPFADIRIWRDETIGQLIGPPKQDRKQSIKNKNNRSLSFHFDLFSGCRFVGLSVCWFVGLPVFPNFRLYLTNYSIKLIYMHIIRTGSMRRLKLCALFVVSTYISYVINENVRKMAKTKTLNFKFMRQMIYHLVGHEIMNITVYFIFHFNAYFSRKWRKCSQNLGKWKFRNTNLRVKRYIIL